jgi:predicted metal-dependent phosphoesterase TrpH
MHEFRADIHCHSDCSDGSDSPEQLLHLALQIGLKGLSITDHDTVEAYSPKLFAMAEAMGLKLLSGIELSTEIGEMGVHVLGYGLDVASGSLTAFLVELQERRTMRNRAILKKLTDKKILISEEELLAFAARKREKRTIGRPHIAALMIEKGYVRTFQDAFQIYLKEGASCYVSGVKYTPSDAIEQIHLAGGKAVLAHPHFLKRSALQRKILSLPFDGIECYYAKLPKCQEKPWLQIAEQKGWIPTGGSDYHGTFKIHNPLGCSWVNEEIFNKLFCP